MAQKRKRVDFAEENAPSTSKQCISGDNQSLQESSATKQTSINFAFEILKLYQTKQYESALSLIDQLKKLPPTHPQYRKEDARTEFKIIEATILAETNREAEAETILKRILEKDPNNSFALYAKGVMLYNNGDFRGSVKPLDRAIALNATSMRRAMDYRAKAGMLIDLVNEANEHFRNNRFTVMVETLRMASQVDPANKKLQGTIDQIRNFLIGQVMGRLESEALGKQPEHYTTAEKLIAGYKLKEASSLIKEIAKEVPRTAKAAFLVGFYNYMRGEIHDACKHFVEAICLDEGCDRYKDYYNKANETQLRLMEISKRWSHQDFQTALQQTNLPEIDPENLVIKELMHFNRSNALLNLGRPDEARDELIKYREIAARVGIDIMENVLKSQQAKQ